MDADLPAKSPVLVVDDDESVRRLLVRELSPHFELIVASGYSEAMSVLRDHGRTLAAIVTDHDLGSGRSGLEVLEAARMEGLRCVRVVVSGDMDEELETRLAVTGLADAAFCKPWRLHAVAALLTALAIHPATLSA